MKKFLIMCLLISLGQVANVQSAEDSDICYVEKKYCEGCDHYHYTHYHVNELDKYRLKGTLKFNYSASSIADSDVKNNEVQRLKDVLSKIGEKVGIIDRHTSDFKIKLDFSENYLTDKSIKELYCFLRTDSLLMNHLISLDISNNKLTEGAFDYIEKIHKRCSDVKINISSNNISLRKFRERFRNESQTIKFSVQ